MSTLTPMDYLQLGGVSGSAMAIMFGIYKILTLVVNHRCRSDCCGRFFSLGISVAETTPPPHRLLVTGEATLGHRLLDGFPMSGTRDGSQSVSFLVSRGLVAAQNTSEEENRSHQSVVAEGRSSPAPSYQSTSPSTAPLGDETV